MEAAQRRPRGQHLRVRELENGAWRDRTRLSPAFVRVHREPRDGARTPRQLSCTEPGGPKPTSPARCAAPTSRLRGRRARPGAHHRPKCNFPLHHKDTPKKQENRLQETKPDALGDERATRLSPNATSRETSVSPRPALPRLRPHAPPGAAAQRVTTKRRPSTSSAPAAGPRDARGPSPTPPRLPSGFRAVSPLSGDIREGF